ncbi:hypothetical protein TEQG_04185 [Trichophyton equinum CBS 127.97]|uniref:Uncharacterized protein n=1 Tax=Trichophyton equinum (strain ATCC MYA-4606 / CBS 127.97) TaxID=559882 RepID=F2PTE9_TRIEC|nr:hypothetical protein TEQG_04185 [Trichophyton equinum CBS 127.97]
MAQEQVDCGLAVALVPSYLWTGDGVDGAMAGRQRSKKRRTTGRCTMGTRWTGRTMRMQWRTRARDGEDRCRPDSWRLLWAGGFGVEPVLGGGGPSNQTELDRSSPTTEQRLD